MNRSSGSLATVWTLLAMLSIAEPSTAQDSALFVGRQYEAGASPNGIAAGDFDGDGASDVAVTNASSEEISILIADGSGGFEDPVHHEMGDDPTAVVVTDLDGDGALDVVVANRGSDDVSLLYGDGAGGFPVTASVPIGDDADDVVVGDVDGDGLPDLTVAIDDVAQVAVRHADGQGGFAEPILFPAEHEMVDMQLGDLDGDGYLDLAVAQLSPGGLRVMPGDGQGGFMAPVATALSGVLARGLAVGDLDADGALDLVATSSPPQSFARIDVLLNDGAGSFPTNVVPFELPHHAGPVALGDLDGDDLLDIVAGLEPGDLVVAHGHGDGTFPVPVRCRFTEPGPLALADLDGDGHLDVVQVEFRVNVALGDGSGVLVTPHALSASGALSVSLTDLDGDGHEDVVASNGLPGPLLPGSNVTIHYGDGAGGSRERVDLALGGGSTSSWDLAVGDVDGDALPDLAVAVTSSGPGPSGLATWLAHPQGGFQAPSFEYAGDDIRSVALADMDDDGHLDAVLASQDTNKLELLYGDGTGDYPERRTLPAGSWPRALEIVDLNHDGWLDILCANFFADFWFYYMTGDGPYVGNIHDSIAPENTDMLLHDVDHDDVLDLVWTTKGRIAVQLGNGFGGFEGEPWEQSVPGPASVVAADLDADGHPDLAVSSPLQSNVTVFLGDGTGVFVKQGTYAVGSTPSDLAVGDLDGDHRPDLAVVEGGARDVCILFNRATWANLGHGLAGGAGSPVLGGSGPLREGEPVELNLFGAAPSAHAFLFLGVASWNLPFLGGTLVPAFQPPLGTFVFLFTGPDGTLPLATTWPGGVPSGTELYAQFWIADGQAPFGYAASNALRGHVP